MGKTGSTRTFPDRTPGKNGKEGKGKESNGEKQGEKENGEKENGRLGKKGGNGMTTQSMACGNTRITPS